MDNLTYSLFDLELPDELNKLSKAIRYSHTILKKLTEMKSIHYEEMTIITLYRKLIENVDGIFVLADNGLESPSISVCRASYEVFLQIEFMFKEEKEINRKALSYYCTWLYEEIVFINKQLQNKELHNRELIMNKEVLLDKLQKNKELLNTEFKSYEKEILRSKQKLKIQHPPKWYSLFNGPKSLNELSKETSLKEAHSILYNGMSAEAHGLKSTTNLTKSSEHLYLAPIRSTSLSLMPINLGRSFITTTTLKIVQKYLPGEYDEFSQFIFTLFQDKINNL